MGNMFRYTVWIVINPNISHDENSIVLDKPRTYDTDSPLNLVVQLHRWMESIENKWPIDEMAAWIERSNDGETLVMTYDQAKGVALMDEAKNHGIDIGDEMFQTEYEFMIESATIAMSNGIGPRS